MSFEPNFEKIVSSYKKRIGEMQSQIECKLPAYDEYLVNKVLSSNVKVNIHNLEWMQNVVNIEGSATVQVIYSTTENNFSTIDYTLEFKDKYISDHEILASELLSQAFVVDIKTSVENSNIKVSAIINIVIDGIFSDSTNTLISSVGDNVFVKYEDIGYASYLGVASEKFDVSTDIEITDNVEKVLTVCPSAYISNIEANQDYVKVYGGVAVNVTYLTSGEKSCIRNFDTTFDFTQEIALSGMTSQCFVTSELSTMYNSLGITTNLDQDKSVINLIVPIEYKGYVFSNVEKQIVSDVYSLENYLNINSQSFTVHKNLMSQTFTEHISGSVILDENDLFIDEILGTCSKDVVIANTRLDNNMLIVDGIASVTVIYKNNEVGATVPYVMQVPFSIDLKVSDIPNDVTIDVLAELIKVNIKARRGVELELNGELILYTTYSKIVKEAVIESVAVADEKQPSEYCLAVYVAKQGDTVWDIAKQMSVSEDLILEQNPNLNLPIEKGTRIVVYKQSFATIN